MKTYRSYIARLVIASMLLLSILPFFASAAVPPASLTSGNYKWEVERGISSTFSHGGCTFPDTLTGNGDTCLVLADYQFETGYDYALVLGVHPYSTTTTGDSVVISVQFKDQNKAKLFSMNCDTIVGAAGLLGSITMLPVNRNAMIPGGYCNIVIKSLADLSSRKFINTYTSMQIVKRRALSYPVSWPFK
jgi:hypothetical protein